MNEPLFSAFEHAIKQWESRRLEELRGAPILPAHWESGKEKRVAKAGKYFFYFARTYFPPEWFAYPFAAAHRQMIDDAMRTDNRLWMYAAPRNFGKTILFRVFKIWCAAFGKKKFYGKVSDTIDLVRDDFRFVRMELARNPKIVADFGEMLAPDWNAMDSFHVPPHTHNPHGTLFNAYSATVTARGALAGSSRLDFLEFDDFEDFSTSVNPDISKAKLETIERDFLPALAEGGVAIYLGNSARTTCIINQLAEMNEADRRALHPAIQLRIVDAWDEKKNRAAWHERYPFATEEKMREALGLSKSVWMGEFRQKPQPPEGTRFRAEGWMKFEQLPNDAKGIIWYDPALGMSSDFKAMALLLYSPSLKKFLAPEAFCRKCSWETLFLGMYDMYNRYRNHILFIAWEKNFGQSKFYEFKNVYTSTRGLPQLPIRFIDNEGEKFWRIEQLEHPYTLGNILFGPAFLSNPDGIEAQNQMIGYRGKKTEKQRLDYPDALASAYRILWPRAMEMGKSAPAIIFGSERRRYV